MTQKFIEFKYNVAWFVGMLASFLIYYSGIFFLYELNRTKFNKKYRKFVLMYHRVCDDNLYPALTIKPSRFVEQMKYLKKKFQILELSELVDTIDGPANNGKDYVSITFDDGFHDNYSCAFPILKKQNIPATIFLISRDIDNNPEMLSKKELSIMKDNSIEFGSHTCTHPILSEINTQLASLEISESKKELEAMIGGKINFFAYPKGKSRDFNDQIKQNVKDSGYIAAFSTENGDLNDKSDHFALSRIGMRNYPLFVFRLRISGIFETRPVLFMRRLFSFT